MQNWIDDRRNWYLPLVGGAEMNRVKPGAIYYVTSMPYPVIEEDNVLMPVEVSRMRFITLPHNLDFATVGVGNLRAKISDKLGDKDYTFKDPDAARVSVGNLRAKISEKLGEVKVTIPPDYGRVSVGNMRVLLQRVLLQYTHPVIDSARVGVGLKGVTLK